MPPKTTKEAVREVGVNRVRQGVGMLQSQTQPSPDQITTGDVGMPNMNTIMNIPGMSPHEVLYTNGDGAPSPDRVVVPRVACGELYAKEDLSQEHDGAVAANPLRERYDNYGNRWLEGGFEYPPYEGHAEGGPETLTSDDVSTGGNEAEAKMGPTFQANGDEKPVVTVEGEETGAPTMRPYKDIFPGPGVCPPNPGSRSDKWPATGLTNFKHPGNTKVS